MTAETTPMGGQSAEVVALPRRDVIARIIDPVSFEMVRQQVEVGRDAPEDATWRCNRARDKAAFIESLFSKGDAALTPVGAIDARTNDDWYADVNQGRRGPPHPTDEQITAMRAALASPPPPPRPSGGEDHSPVASQALPASPSPTHESGCEPSTWLPIASAPRDGTRILLWCPEPSHSLQGGRRDPIGVAFGYVDEFDDGSIWAHAEQMSGSWNFTRWMPLPAPPSEGSQHLSSDGEVQRSETTEHTSNVEDGLKSSSTGGVE
jgi:hypothetical protein